MTNQSMSDPTGWPDFRLANKPPDLQRLIAYDRSAEGATPECTENGRLGPLPGMSASGRRAAGRRNLLPARVFGYIAPFRFRGTEVFSPMLKTMRESFHQLKWTLWAVVIVFILGFVYFSGSGTNPNDRSTDTIARVGSTPITAAEFDREYRQQLERYRDQYRGSLTPEMLRFLDLPRQVLNGMIDRRLQLDEARRLKLAVSNDEVARAVMSYPAFQQNGQFIGREKYVELLARYGFTPERFEEGLREDLLSGKYAALVRSSILVPDSEL